MIYLSRHHGVGCRPRAWRFCVANRNCRQHLNPAPDRCSTGLLGVPLDQVQTTAASRAPVSTESIFREPPARPTPRISPRPARTFSARRSWSSCWPRTSSWSRSPSSPSRPTARLPTSSVATSIESWVRRVRTGWLCAAATSSDARPARSRAAARRSSSGWLRSGRRVRCR